VQLQYPDSVDALIIFHHEWEALEFAARSFKNFYPEGSVFIARDTLPVETRSSLDELDCTYLPTYRTTQLFIDLRNEKRELDSLTILEFREKISNDLGRISSFLKASKANYLLFMEADSLVLKKFQISSEVDMDSLDANKYPRKFLKKVNFLSGRRFPLKGWGFVTGYVKSSTLRETIDWCEENNEVLVDLFLEDKRFSYLDHFLPIVVHLAGGNVGNLKQVGECLRDKNWDSNQRFALLHQYRLNY